MSTTMKISSLRSSITTVALTLLTPTYATARSQEIEVNPDPSPGCQNTIDHATLAEISTKLQDHALKVTLPPSYDAKKPNPLILVYNDRDVTMEDLVESSGLSDAEVNGDAVVVYVMPRKGVRTTSTVSLKEILTIGRAAGFPMPISPFQQITPSCRIRI
jgi:hypothetical protein